MHDASAESLGTRYNRFNPRPYVRQIPGHLCFVQMSLAFQYQHLYARLLAKYGQIRLGLFPVYIIVRGHNQQVLGRAFKGGYPEISD